MEGLEDELTCPVCLELFTCPLQLPCHHNLCRRCAEVLLQSETNPSQDDEEGATCSAAAAASPENTPDSFPCPTCREGVSLNASGLDGLRKNFLLQNIVDRYLRLKGDGNTRHEIPCQLCRETPPRMAAKSCLVCKVSYCEQCLTLTHPDFPPFSEHKLVSPTASFNDEEPQTVMCPDHPSKPVEMYCVQDQTPVCLLCEKVGKHKQHSMAALEEVFSQKQAELRAWVDRLGARVTLEEAKVQKLEGRQGQIMTSAQELRTEIDKQCESLVEVIQHRKAELHRKLEQTRQQDSKDLQKVIKPATDGIQKAQAALSYSLEVLKETDHASLLLAHHSLKAKIEGTIKSLGSDSDDNYDDELAYGIDELEIDFTQRKEELEALEFGAIPDSPVIADEVCCTSSMEEAYIEWEPVEEACEYEVCYSVGDVQIVSTLKGCSYSATNLTPGTKYKFEVASKNKAGRSCPSSIELATMPFKFQLDQNTASRYLLVSEENTQVSKLETPIPLPKASLTSSRFNPVGDDEQHTVLGDKSIKRGRHYWEVSVTGEYSIGVAYESMPRDEDISNTEESWAFDYLADGCMYRVMADGQVLFEKHIKRPLSKIGILVDYDKSELCFINAKKKTVIFRYKRKAGFTKPLYPAFSLHSGSQKIHSGIECPQ
ncbi:PREDICTED: E3 ubiquitin-protein ligase Midline-1-like [Branchiostoma belcheri]|uniref:E3 ubiquitin-protein ligase Midline-1-like n=1 Tax=Branchiostoma belcheri TaxID=7741 RepID=A0A6P4YAQ4_BRABE|nr:PREDICTED: E3 ubiquitin-protein ligase Midline-1-like [Branchiostoma belcheri]